MSSYRAFWWRSVNARDSWLVGRSSEAEVDALEAGEVRTVHVVEAGGVRSAEKPEA